MRVVALGILFCLSSAWTFAQKSLNAGIGYFGQNLGSPGLVIELERESQHQESFSLPARLDLGFCMVGDYNSLFIDLSQGFRLNFSSGLFLEQFVGIGVISNFYSVEGIFYQDAHGSMIRYNDGANPGAMPSASIGFGYDLDRKADAARMVWVRPKVYWNLGLRGLNLPFWAIQAGYTWTLKARDHE